MRGYLLGWSIIGFTFMMTGVCLGLISDPINTYPIIIGISLFIGLSIFGVGAEFILYLQSKYALSENPEEKE